MKKYLSLLLVLLLIPLSAGAVLKENSLAKTLAVLRGELTEKCERQQQEVERYERSAVHTRQQLVNYMNQCEQIGLMLYSQRLEDTFEISYACTQAIDFYEMVSTTDGSSLDYDRMVRQVTRNIEEYEALILTLKSIPPVDAKDKKKLLSKEQSLLLSSLTEVEVADTTSQISALQTDLKMLLTGKRRSQMDEPLYLSGTMLDDRNACVNYATDLLKILRVYRARLEGDKEYYDTFREKAEELNDFALKRYALVQDQIFNSGEGSFFKTLTMTIKDSRHVMNELHDKYIQYDDADPDNESDWKGIKLLLSSVFFIFYILLMTAVVYLLLKYCTPKKFRTESFELKRPTLSVIFSVALVMLVLYVYSILTDVNHMLMLSLEMLFNTASIYESIYLFVFLRVDDEKLNDVFKVYMPILVMAFIITLFRITLSPTVITSLALPPIALVLTIIQARRIMRYRDELPTLDIAYAYTSLVLLVFCTVASFVGYTFLAIQVTVFWCNLLAYLIIINGLSSLVKRSSWSFLQKKWVKDLIHDCLLPILVVVSIPASIYYASDMFSMTASFKTIFYTNYIDQEGLIQISLHKLCICVALWFVFSYASHTFRSAYVNMREKFKKDNDSPNTALARNLITVGSWGIYIISVLVILKVPRSGISIVTAGLATGLGFAMKDLLENFVYGISLMTGRLRVGDIIECDGVSGTVDSISYQYTTILTFDGTLVAFLNSALFNKNFRNLTRNHQYVRIVLNFGVAYGSDVNFVREVVNEAMKPLTTAKTPADKYYMDQRRQPEMIFDELGDSSLNMKIYCWVRVDSQRGFKSMAIQAVYEALNKNGITIPFPQRDIHIYNE